MKKILVILQPHRPYKGSLLEMLVKSLEQIPLEVSYLDITDVPKYRYSSVPDKIKNIFHRLVFKNKQYILQLENNFVNHYYLRQLNKRLKKKEKFDYVLIIKPEEYSPKFIKKASSLGTVTVGYIWDGLRLYLKPNLIKSRLYLKYLYSFDTNNIDDFPELTMEFCTNFLVPQKHMIPYNTRDNDLYYIGDVGGGLKSQRRDLKLSHFLANIQAKSDIKLLNLLHLPENEKVSHPLIEYIQQPIPMQETFERVRNTKAVIDICKNHHIGLSFRFFECLAAETKIITNNMDVKNYDFYNPNNIMLVDFDQNQLSQEELDHFLKTPYQSVDQKILQSYSIENWFWYLFRVNGYQKIQKT